MAELNREELRKEVVKLISEQLSVPVENIKDESTLSGDLQADSLDAVELVMSIEDKFDIEITEAQTQQLKSVGDIINFIENIRK